MNLDELRPILHAYRQQAEQAWSPATAHPDFEGKAGDPAGQCGVTSAWLQRRLLEDHGIETTYVVGVVYTSRGEMLEPHCWLEAYHGDSVLDLTIAQASGLERLQVVCEDYSTLWVMGLRYVADDWPSAERLSADPVQARLALLTEAVGS